MSNNFITNSAENATLKKRLERFFFKINKTYSF